MTAPARREGIVSEINTLLGRGTSFEGKLTFDDVRGVHLPVVVARGLRDEVGPGAFAPLVADALPDGTLADYAHLGHFGPLEDPTTIAADAAGFLAAHL